MIAEEMDVAAVTEFAEKTNCQPYHLMYQIN